MKLLRVALGMALALGCARAQSPTDSGVPVQWIDRDGKTWFAPPVTPAAGDPILALHPEPGVVAIDRRTGERTVIRDPSEFLRQRRQQGPDQTLILIRAADSAPPAAR